MRNIKTFGPDEVTPEGIILPVQTHGSNIMEIVAGDEGLSDCDGIWTQRNSTPSNSSSPGGEMRLGVKTADCAPICFWEDGRYGVMHTGWRGLCNGIIPKMMTNFENPQIWVGPILPTFEIKKDFCYELLYEQFGDPFFIKIDSDKYIFDFKGALQSLFPMAEFDSRSTFETPNLASWRRDQNDARNITVIW